nr:hypothetical protein [uncultured Bacillus sp.]
MSFAQFDDIYEICYGWMEEDEAFVKEEKSSSTKLDNRRMELPEVKMQREKAPRESSKEKEIQLIYK